MANGTLCRYSQLARQRYFEGAAQLEQPTSDGSPPFFFSAASVELPEASYRAQWCPIHRTVHAHTGGDWTISKVTVVTSINGEPVKGSSNDSL